MVFVVICVQFSLFVSMVDVWETLVCSVFTVFISINKCFFLREKHNLLDVSIFTGLIGCDTWNRWLKCFGGSKKRTKKINKLWWIAANGGDNCDLFVQMHSRSANWATMNSRRDANRIVIFAFYGQQLVVFSIFIIAQLLLLWLYCTKFPKQMRMKFVIFAWTKSKSLSMNFAVWFFVSNI